jgi:hypothetical protein
MTENSFMTLRSGLIVCLSCFAFPLFSTLPLTTEYGTGEGDTEDPPQ